MKIPKLKAKPFNMDDCMRAFVVHPNTPEYLLEKFPDETAELVRKLNLPRAKVEIPDGAKTVGKCWECDTFAPIHEHHVIPEVYGGRRTIPLCEICHGKVHSRALTNHRALTIAGIHAARARGVIMGRSPTLNKVEPLVNLWLEEKSKGRTLRAFCKEHGISTSTLRRAVSRLAA